MDRRPGVCCRPKVYLIYKTTASTVTGMPIAHLLQDAIDCCNKYGVVLLTTGVRHFRH